MTGQAEQINDVPEDDESPAPDSSIGGIGFAAVVTLLGVVFLIQSLQIQSQAGIWPRILAISLVLLAGAQTILAVVQRLKQPSSHAIALPSWRRLFTAAWLLLYCVAAQWVGFGAAMLVFVPVYMVVMGYRKPIWIVLITAGFALGLTFVFDTVANVPVWSSRL